MMKVVAFSFLAILFLATARADDSIQLPSGTAVKIASFAAHPKWRESFPPDQPFFAEKYAEGNLEGMHARYSGRLDGASVTLHENGNLKVLTYYPEGQQQGSCRVWDEDKHMLLYSKYRDNKKHGITCLFKNDTPWLAQEWNKGDLESETVLVRKGSDFVASYDAKQLDEAKKKLATIETEVDETKSDLKKSLGKWFLDEKSRIEKEKDKILTKASTARGEARWSAIRKEQDERVAAYHTHPGGLDRVGMVGATDARIAAQHEKAADKNTKAVVGEAKRELTQIDKEITKHDKELYHFALAALEKSLPDKKVSSTDKQVPPSSEDTSQHKKRKHRANQ